MLETESKDNENLAEKFKDLFTRMQEECKVLKKEKDKSSKDKEKEINDLKSARMEATEK